MERSDIGADHEIWQCQEGPTKIAVDVNGCPIDSLYCKIQAGGVSLAIAAGATVTITVTVVNLTYARVAGLVIASSNPAVVAPAGPGNMNAYVGITSINILGNEHVSGEVTADRYTRDATGVKGVGTGQTYRGGMGTAGAVALIVVTNRSAVAINVWATLDVTGKKAA